MTTTDERRRNLIWGLEALQELSADTTLPLPWRAKAAEVLGSYPSTEMLSWCSEDALELLQIQHAEVLTAARTLFQRIRASAACSDQRRYMLLVILRHFY